ncbi:MAG TPA: DUF4382 domain-containing protein [Chitinophagaceae bacterium]|nr:DUF4382 domain-containing protein [Chitinophagaceae bacterium]
MKKINVFLCILTLGIAMSSCKKDSSKKSYPYAIRMTDAPGPYSAVNIDLQGVEITGSGGKTVSLNVNTGIYNLINFSNGIDTLIANGTLEDATVQQIRLILGTNNTVVIDNVSYPLSTPSADQSGLKLQVHQTLQAGVLYSVLLDFDANKSVIETGNGTYKLKPVIRTIETAISGSIKGQVTPAGTIASVTATSSSNVTYTSNTNSSGNYLVMGLPAGIYSITITPALPLSPVTINNVSVTTGVTTNAGITLF